MLDFLLYSLLPFLFILGFCVTIHEFGHFLCAKIFRIPVEKFSIGFGPPIFRKQIGETDFRIAYFPLGGYVKMAGEDEGEILPTKKNNAHTQPPNQTLNERPGFYDTPAYKRILVVFTGPLFNIISAFFVLLLIFNIYGIVVTPYTKIEVSQDSPLQAKGFLSNDSIIAVNNHPLSCWEDFLDELSRNKKQNINITIKRGDSIIKIQGIFEPDSLIGIQPIIPPVFGSIKNNGPADRAGMKKGDRIIEINNKEIKTWQQMVNIVRAAKKETLLIMWQHNGEIKKTYIIPVLFYDPIADDTVGQIGVFMPYGRKYPGPLTAFALALKRSAELISQMISIFRRLLTRQISTHQIGGPIAIFKLSAESAHWGFEHLLGLLVVISINLGLINLFPIPALDGGHILIAIIEVIRRKHFSRRSRLVIQQIGYIIILLLIILVTYNDITR